MSQNYRRYHINYHTATGAKYAHKMKVTKFFYLNSEVYFGPRKKPLMDFREGPKNIFMS